jgi:ACS family tartrate transporter-like MFS transporter
MEPASLESAVGKAMRRLVPLSMMLFFFSLLDRTNISFAALEMNKDLGLSPPQYGTAAGIFFIGYFLFEIPSNFLLQYTGARLWLARIMVTWGLVVMAMAYIQGVTSLYVLRFLLGVAEAGLLPGLLLYLGLWLPAQQRAVAYATLLSTAAIAYAIGAPFTTFLMRFSFFGFHGWQFMYLTQGLLTVLVGLLVFAILPNRIDDASWLAQAEKSALNARLKAEAADKQAAGATSLWQGFFDLRVLLTTITCFFLVCANFGTVLWLPQILKALFPDLENFQISLLVSFAFLIGGAGGIFWGRHSDRTGDRKWHIAASAMLAAAGYGLAGSSASPLMQFVGICIGILGIWSISGVFWAYAGDLLGGDAATGGLALINSVGSVGGLVAPIALAYALQNYGSVAGSLYALAAFSLATAVLASILRPIAIGIRPSSGVRLAT